MDRARIDDYREDYDIPIEAETDTTHSSGGAPVRLGIRARRPKFPGEELADNEVIVRRVVLEQVIANYATVYGQKVKADRRYKHDVDHMIPLYTARAWLEMAYRALDYAKSGDLDRQAAIQIAKLHTTMDCAIAHRKHPDAE